jgi:hypothetical protein
VREHHSASLSPAGEMTVPHPSGESSILSLSAGHQPKGESSTDPGVMSQISRLELVFDSRHFADFSSPLTNTIILCRAIRLTVMTLLRFSLELCDSALDLPVTLSTEALIPQFAHPTGRSCSWKNRANLRSPEVIMTPFTTRSPRKI